MKPDKDTPEYDLWIAAIEVAIAPPLTHGIQYAAKVPWSLIEDLREKLDAVGIDWKTAKAKHDKSTRAYR